MAIRLVFNQLWANNGDAISRQYAGTAAMKGDYTRTGERKFSGLMRDGVKSANRYSTCSLVVSNYVFHVVKCMYCVMG